MLKPLISFFLIIGINVAAYAQNIETYFDSQKTIPFQKLYLHTDREFYFTRDTLWFAAYLVEADSNIPANESCNLYVDLIDAKGKIVKNELFLIQNGLGQGWLSLLDSTEIEGNFLLRAYTDYLKNFGNDAFFTKTIRISTVKNSFELTSEKVPPVSPSPDKPGLRPQLSPLSRGTVGAGSFEEATAKTGGEIDISFLPEGGFLLAGESNCVAFKAVDESGKGIPVSGTLFDDKNKPVLTFKSIYKGAGKFYFYPKAGKTYSAKIDGFPEKKFKLPDVRETGSKIMVVNQGNNHVQVVIQGKNVNRGSYYLAAMNRGNGLFYMEINRKKMNAVLKINQEKFKSGINRLVLLDNKLNPLSERLIFVKNNEINHLQVRLNEDKFSTRENVQLNIKDTTTSEISFLSVAVVDENYLNATGISQNIASYLLLDSELKGHIESPADYFVSEDSLDSHTRLDLLMTTNGWSNYIWNDIEKDSLKMEFNPKLGFAFEGHVKRGIGKKALPEGNVSMMLFKSDSTKQLIDQPLDANGDFNFQNIVFFDSASVFVQARNKRNQNSIKFEMELPKVIPPPIDNQQLNTLHDFSNVPVSVYRQRYFNEMRLKEFYPDKDTRLIKEVIVTEKAKLKRNEIMEDFFGPGNKTATVEENDDFKYGTLTLSQYLLIKGIHVRGGNNLQSLDSMGPKILLDGSPQDIFRLDDPKFTMGQNLNMIKRIEVFDGPNAAIFGFGGVNGVINIITKKGEDLLNEPARLLGGMVEKLKGFTSLREFYSPKYTPENIASKAPDFRNTLYWNPNVILEKGQTEVYFFTCDNISRYKVLVEGISENGNVCLGSADFEINKYINSQNKMGVINK